MQYIVRSQCKLEKVREPKTSEEIYGPSFDVLWQKLLFQIYKVRSRLWKHEENTSVKNHEASDDEKEYGSDEQSYDSEN